MIFYLYQFVLTWYLPVHCQGRPITATTVTCWSELPVKTYRKKKLLNTLNSMTPPDTKYASCIEDSIPCECIFNLLVLCENLEMRKTRKFCKVFMNLLRCLSVEVIFRKRRQGTKLLFARSTTDTVGEKTSYTKDKWYRYCHSCGFNCLSGKNDINSTSVSTIYS